MWIYVKNVVILQHQAHVMSKFHIGKLVASKLVDILLQYYFSE